MYFSKKVEVFKAFLEFMSLENISLSNLQWLSHIVSYEDFMNFCQSKNIDLASKKFEKLDLFSGKFLFSSPLSDLNTESPSIINILLSRSFSKAFSKDEITSVYSNLYNLSPISKEMLVYTAGINFEWK